MPVDTYLKGKNLAQYLTVEQEGLRVHIAPALAVWAERVTVDASRFLLWRRFEVEVAHRHQPT